MQTKPNERQRKGYRQSDFSVGKLTGQILRFPGGEREPTAKEFFDMNSENLFPYSDRHTPSTLFREKFSDSEILASITNRERRRGFRVYSPEKSKLDSLKPFNMEKFIGEEQLEKEGKNKADHFLERCSNSKMLTHFQEKLQSPQNIMRISNKTRNPRGRSNQGRDLSPEDEVMKEFGSRHLKNYNDYDEINECKENDDLHRLRKQLKEIGETEINDDSDASLAWLGAGKLSPITNKGETSFFSNKRDMNDIERDLADADDDLEDFSGFEYFNSCRKKRSFSSTAHYLRRKSLVGRVGQRPNSQEISQKNKGSGQDAEVSSVNSQLEDSKMAEEKISTATNKILQPPVRQKERKSQRSDELKRLHQVFPQSEKTIGSCQNNLSKLFEEAEIHAQKLDNYVANFVNMEDYLGEEGQNWKVTKETGDIQYHEMEAVENDTRQFRPEKQSKKIKVIRNVKERKFEEKTEKRQQDSKKLLKCQDEAMWYAFDDDGVQYDGYSNDKIQRQLLSKENSSQQTPDQKNELLMNESPYLTPQRLSRHRAHEKNFPKVTSSSSNRSFSSTKKEELARQAKKERVNDRPTLPIQGHRKETNLDEIHHQLKEGNFHASSQPVQLQKKTERRNRSKHPESQKEMSQRTRKRKQRAKTVDKFASAFTVKTLAMREETVQLEKGFYGENNRYPKRVRIPTLFGWANERVETALDNHGNPTFKVIRVDLEAMCGEEYRYMKGHQNKKMKVRSKGQHTAKDEKRVQLSVFQVATKSLKDSHKLSKVRKESMNRTDDYLESLKRLKIPYEVVSTASESTTIVMTLKPGKEKPTQETHLHMQLNVVNCQSNKAKAIVNDKVYALTFNSTFEVLPGFAFSLHNGSKTENLEIKCTITK